MEQEYCTGARGGLMPDSAAADVLSHKLVGALKQYVAHFHLTNAGAAVEQEASTGAQRLAPGLAAHVLSGLLRALQMDDLHHEETKSRVISSRLSEKFEGAIKLSAEPLTNVKFMHEIDIIGKYFEEISQDTGKYVVGVDDTMQVLDTGAIETIIVWENLDITRYVLKYSSTGETIIKHLNKEQDADESNFREPTTNGELEIIDKMPLLEWLANEYRKFGCSLEFVTNKSQEGSQFCRGFGGIGAILRYKLDVRAFDDVSDDGEVYEEVYVDSE
ncbi:PREDICTED: eukaryotic peptide chain release factor subunit 1-3-like [Nicotiana attenuata]|uniref:eukaryotic peptide chain release factor subunit 1-3-like n=1 Tax=Nicotiana attenuata TaxID=49451 RepID=UPI00090539C6|nr:PREDICTED: eukaryotic peptide chain release factor subunit 1-3-like [Nicotiana attenuata]